MSIATMLFFMWGFLTCLNDILIPHLKAIFDLNYAQAMLVQFCFFSSYFIFALPSGKLVEWVGYKQSMVVGLLVMAAGAFLFLPASKVASFGLFLSALIILAAGITCLQVAANPYVANLGPPETCGFAVEPGAGVQFVWDVCCAVLWKCADSDFDAGDVGDDELVFGGGVAAVQDGTGVFGADALSGDWADAGAARDFVRRAEDADDGFYAGHQAGRTGSDDA